MLLTIPNVLTKAQVAHCRKRLDEAAWVDGNSTSGSQSMLVKHNTQVAEGSPIAVELGDLVLEALGAAPLFVSAALPLKTFPPLFNRYGPGDSFGAHVDNAIRPVKGTYVRVRTDISCTLFLTEPEAYDGGELVIEDVYGAQEVKLFAGDMVVYPASSLHQVNPITRGERVSCFFWVQSMVKEDQARAMLFDLDQSIQEHAAEHGMDHALNVKLSNLYHNLVRRWSET